MASFKPFIKRPDHATLPRPNVLGISGSPRKGGNSDLILRHIINGAGKNNISSAKIRLADVSFGPCIGCEQCRKNKICTGLMDGLSPLYPKILDSRGLILVSPTHNYNITAWMKAFIDRLYCFYIFDNHRPRGWASQLSDQGRKAVIAAVCEQKDEEDMGFTMEAMRRPIQALGYDIVGELTVFNIFDKAGVKAHSNTLKKAENLGIDLADSLKNNIKRN